MSMDCVRLFLSPYFQFCIPLGHLPSLLRVLIERPQRTVVDELRVCFRDWNLRTVQVCLHPFLERRQSRQGLCVSLWTSESPSCWRDGSAFRFLSACCLLRLSMQLYTNCRWIRPVSAHFAFPFPLRHGWRAIHHDRESYNVFTRIDFFAVLQGLFVSLGGSLTSLRTLDCPELSKVIHWFYWYPNPSLYRPSLL